VPLQRCDRATVELALAKPRASYAGADLYPTLADKAAALTWGLAKSQACSDGNKRIALLLVVAFLYVNGCRLDVQPGDVAEMILRVAEADQQSHDQVIAETRDWIAQRMRRRT